MKKNLGKYLNIKKILITGFYFTVTAIVCAIGFRLPSAWCKYQDKQIYAKIERPKVEPITLTYSSSLYDTLQLLTGDYYFVEYPYAGSIHTEAEIHKIVSALIKKMERSGILTPNALPYSPNAIEGQSASLSLAIASDSGVYNTKNGFQAAPTLGASDYRTAFIWDCTVYFEDTSILLMSIDDKSGKLVGFNIYNSREISDYMTDMERKGAPPHLKFANAVAKFLKKHYQMKTNAVWKETREPADKKIYDQNALPTEYVYSIKLTDDSGNTLQLPLTNNYHQIDFN